MYEHQKSYEYSDKLLTVESLHTIQSIVTFTYAYSHFLKKEIYHNVQQFKNQFSHIPWPFNIFCGGFHSA